jgi:hypothetical protein
MPEGAVYACESPHHHRDSDSPTVTIWATRCNGRIECYLGADEDGCDPKLVVYIILGKQCASTLKKTSCPCDARTWWYTAPLL